LANLKFFPVMMKGTLATLTLAASLLLALQPQAKAQSTESALRAGDSIIVKLSGAPAEEINVVSTNYDISDQGTINLPYINEVKAAGLKPSILQKNIEAAYRNADVFTHPTIQVTANREAATQVVYVSGEVKAPGRINMTPGMTVHDVITSASGPTDFAAMKKVKFTRGSVTREIDLRRADNPDAAIPAQPGDKIHVPQ
jgi:protein involved in polysaccharide export with SLBB domain